MRVHISKPNRGFTLVELLVVIGIIGVLISLLMPGYSKARAAANKVVCESNMRQIGQAMMMYADASEGFLFPGTMGADVNHITDFPSQLIVPTPPGAPGTLDAQGNVVYYLTWPGVVLASWTGAPPALPPSSPTADPALLAFTRIATGPLMFCPADDPAPYAYHSYIVNSHVAYWNAKFSTKLPGGQSSGSVILMGEKVTAQCDYYMEYGDFKAGKVDLTRHGIVLGSNYLYLDLHVDNQPGIPGDDALDPWDFANGAAPPAGTGGTTPPAN